MSKEVLPVFIWIIYYMDVMTELVQHTEPLYRKETEITSVIWCRKSNLIN